jgi:hypothetical protein
VELSGYAAETLKIREVISYTFLTGITDHKIAINAFNDGIIDKFIMKDDPNLFTSLDQAIVEMQKKYFGDLSELVIKNITASTFSYLENRKFIDFFLHFIKTNYISEFYLIDPIGSFLLLNARGELMWLVIKSDQDIMNDCQIAIDQNALGEIISALSDRRKLLFLFSEEDYKQPVENWPSYFHSAQKIEDIQGCFYSLIQGERAYEIAGICKEKIFIYENNIHS